MRELVNLGRMTLIRRSQGILVRVTNVKQSHWKPTKPRFLFQRCRCNSVFLRDLRLSRRDLLHGGLLWIPMWVPTNSIEKINNNPSVNSKLHFSQDWRHDGPCDRRVHLLDTRGCSLSPQVDSHSLPEETEEKSFKAFRYSPMNGFHIGEILSRPIVNLFSMWMFCEYAFKWPTPIITSKP